MPQRESVPSDADRYYGSFMWKAGATGDSGAWVVAPEGSDARYRVGTKLDARALARKFYAQRLGVLRGARGRS